MSAFDISDTLAPKSDQLDAVDLLGGPRTFTVTGASKGSAEQPVNVDLAEFPRTWRPSKGMRRVLAAVWGTDSGKWVGRRLTLFCDPTVKFGGIEVGGIRISHMSHIDKPAKVPLLIAKGKSAVCIVEPLRESTQPAALSNEDARLVAELREEWKSADPERQAAIQAEVAAIQAGAR